MPEDYLYIQDESNVESTLIDACCSTLEIAEEYCGASIYALRVEYYEGDMGKVIACHDYLQNGHTTVLRESAAPDKNELYRYVKEKEAELTAKIVHCPRCNGIMVWPKNTICVNCKGEYKDETQKD